MNNKTYEKLKKQNCLYYITGLETYKYIKKFGVIADEAGYIELIPNPYYAQVNAVFDKKLADIILLAINPTDIGLQVEGTPDELTTPPYTVSVHLPNGIKPEHLKFVEITHTAICRLDGGAVCLTKDKKLSKHVYA